MPKNNEAKRTLRAFYLASFLNDVGSDMVYSLWPLFVRVFLGADMLMLGLIDGLGDAIVSISQAVSGYMSDRLKRRKVFIWTGYTFGSLSRVGYSLSAVWQQLIPFRILDRLGKMRDAPRDAMVADISTHQNRGGNFGLLRMMDYFGAMVGVTISIIFFGMLGYRMLFLLAAIPSILGVVLILAFVREKKLKELKLFKGLKLKDLDRNFKLFLFLSSIFALGSFSYSFLLIYANDFGFQTITIPVLYLVFTTMAFLSAYSFGKLSDRIGRKAVMALSFMLWMSVTGVLILAQSAWAIVSAFVLYGLHIGSLEPIQKTFVSELAPKEFRASGLGSFRMITGLCALPASLIAGILWDVVGRAAPLYLSLGLTGISLILLLAVKERNPQKSI